jgi:2-polyprenyl-3-methyl-5-hydroxy-6-metoxy-1,4-benzoquinol methylase
LKWSPSITYLHRRLIFLRNIRLISRYKNILEIVSGSGSILAEIKRIYPQINTYSHDKSMKSRQLIRYFTPKSTILNKLKPVSKKMDCIIFFEVMKHIEDDQKFLKIVSDSLVDNGLIIFSVPAHQKK